VFFGLAECFNILGNISRENPSAIQFFEKDFCSNQVFIFGGYGVICPGFKIGFIFQEAVPVHSLIGNEV